MESGLKQEKSTGYTPPIKTAKENASVQPKSTGRKKVSPVLKNVLTMAGSSNSGGEVSASNILAVQMMMGDFREVKAQMPKSWQASSNGKIYWCADFTGHTLKIVEGKLLVDDLPADLVIAKLLGAK
jgi:hypothetical protein